MDYWKSKVLPKMKTIFAKSAGKKAAAAAELAKSFDESKEGINGEFEKKKADLQPKVVEIYEGAAAAVKVLIKQRKVSGIKKNSAAVAKFMEDLADIDFPGAKQVSEGIAKVGPALLSGPLFATFDKVATLLPATEEAPKELPAAEKVADAEEKKEEAAEKKEEAASEEKQTEEVQPPAAAAAEETAVAAAAESAPAAAAAAEALPVAEESAAPVAEAPEAAAPLAEAEPAKALEETTPKA